MAAPTKFTVEQLDLMEKAFNDGLCSTNMSLHAGKYERLSLETGIDLSKLKTWINNRKRKGGICSSSSQSSAAPSPAASGSSARLEVAGKSLKRAPCNRRTSAWNLFLSRTFKGELKDVPKEEKSKRAQELYSTLSAEEKEELEKEAKLAADVDVESMAPEDIDKCLSHSMQRVMKEMQYMEQFGCTGFCLAMKPSGKLLTASTIKGEEFLMSDNAMTRRFSEFCSVPVKQRYTKLEARIFLNKKYSLVTGMPTRVPYKNYQKTFRVEGWPEDVPFKTPARMGPTQLEKVMLVKDEISFIVLDPLVCHPASVPVIDANSSSPVTQSVENDVITSESSANEPQTKRAKRAKKLSFIGRSDIVPVYASRSDPNEEDDEDTYRFWLFQCNSKVKTNGTIMGKWLAQSEEERSFIILPQHRSIFENNVMVCDGKRLVLAADDFEVVNDGKYQLTVATFQRLQDIAVDLQVCA